jgi:hypothetical protein
LTKPFSFVTYEWAKQARVFVPGKPFQSSEMFTVRLDPIWVKLLSGAYLLGWLLALPENIKAGNVNKKSSLFGSCIRHKEKVL